MCFLYQRDSAIDVCCSPLIQTEDVFRVEPLLTPPPHLGYLSFKGSNEKRGENTQIHTHSSCPSTRGKFNSVLGPLHPPVRLGSGCLKWTE